MSSSNDYPSNTPKQSESTKQVASKQSPLFRTEVIDEQRSEWLGTVLLAPAISHTIYALVALSCAVGILALLIFGEYTRKERVNGWLIPEQGIFQVFAPRSGTIIEIQAKDGQIVKQADKLLTVSSDLQTKSGGTKKEAIKLLEQRRQSLRNERDTLNDLYQSKEAGLAAKIKATEDEIKYRRQEKKVQSQLVALANSASKGHRAARKKGIISQQKWRNIEADRLDQLMRLRVLEREMSVANRELHEFKAQLGAMPLELRQQLALIDRNINKIVQEITETEALRQVVLTAPVAGMVTALQSKLGANVNTTLPILSIVPEGSQLIVQLFVPSKAIGFIEQGQSVLLRYSAFAYQKFGHYRGVISNISRSSLAPSELSPQMRLISSANSQGKGNNQSVYSVEVTLESQFVDAYGKQLALQPGMLLEADILIERRRLYEWLLAPLYSLNESLKQ